MDYIIAVDGGGSKTKALCINLKGETLLEIIESSSNHQHVGVEQTTNVLTSIYNKSKKMLSKDKIVYVYLGMSGLDTDYDYNLLKNICDSIFVEEYKICNDAFLILRSGLDDNYGACAICGTGTNSCAINGNKKYINRALSYELGSFGGGSDVARMALHYAFRADEKTGDNTILTSSIPQHFNKQSMSELVELLYPTNNISESKISTIAKLVVDGSLAGDSICIKILEHTGETIALNTIGVIKRANMTCDISKELPVVIGGGMFSPNNTILINSFIAKLKKEVITSYVITPTKEPAYGAFLLALDELSITL